MILHEDSQNVVIATFNTSNRKTGSMVQIWILNKHMNPAEAVKTGNDSTVCGSCKHRGTSCYVNVGFAPNNIFKAYKQGKYKPAKPKHLLAEDVRFGAYGDPAFIPLSLIHAISVYANSYTGYTHQWEHCHPDYKNYLMASVDTLDEMKKAQSMGWSTFRVLADDDEPELFESRCPSDVITCKQCKKCDGKSGNIYIPVHGPKHKIQKFNVIVKELKNE